MVARTRVEGLEPLARAVAERGAVVFVPDWRSDAPDGGRRHLLESAAFVRKNAETFGADARRVLLAGWSMGGRAAAALGIGGDSTGWRPCGVVCVASSFDRPATSTGTAPLAEIATTTAEPVPFWLVHGVRDPIVEAERSRRFAAALRGRGWPVTLLEVESDHAGVVMTEYAAERGRCVPARDAHAIETGLLTARLIADAAASLPARDPE
ncbi:alpha/beta hydrolase [Microtetraspora fusca]|uniref:Alpha/beta hydrolase n=1 Tax=Microtetraspora fusca TaxID=1997 RepID=A0ABW6VCQ1_MICFU